MPARRPTSQCLRDRESSAQLLTLSPFKQHHKPISWCKPRTHKAGICCWSLQACSCNLRLLAIDFGRDVHQPGGELAVVQLGPIQGRLHEARLGDVGLHTPRLQQYYVISMRCAPPLSIRVEGMPRGADGCCTFNSGSQCHLASLLCRGGRRRKAVYERGREAVVKFCGAECIPRA